MINRSQNWDGRERRSPASNTAPATIIAASALPAGLRLTARRPESFTGLSVPANSRAVEAESTASADPVRVRAPMPNDLAVGRRIRQIRRSTGRTLAQLASTVGVTGAQLHRYETGTTRVAASRMIAIAEALGVLPEVLLSSASPALPAPAPGPVATGDDLLELIQLFGAIGDPTKRDAVLAIARMMAPSHPSGSSGY